MANTAALKTVAEDSIKVAINVHKGIAAHARGNPAQIVAVATAAAIVAVGVGLGAGVYYGTKAAFSRNA